MTEDKKHHFKEKLAALHEKYCRQLPDKYNEIEQSWQAYQGDFSNNELYEVFYRYIHTLKGTAATFGFNTQADICFEVQKILNTIKEQSCTPEQTVSLINEQLAKLKAYINAPADSIDD